MIEVVKEQYAMRIAQSMGGAPDYPAYIPVTTFCFNEIRRCFPEFSEHRWLREWCQGYAWYVLQRQPASSTRLLADGLRPWKPASSSANETFELDVALLCRKRPDIYEFEYTSTAVSLTPLAEGRLASLDAVADGKVLSDLWEFLSCDAEMPADVATLARQVNDLANIWSATETDVKWQCALAQIKCGLGSLFHDQALDAGFDSMVDAYFAGVPVEVIANR